MSGQGPLIGRDDEQALLDAALARCRSGEGALILVSGEAGVGKTRLVTDVLARWDGRVRANAPGGAAGSGAATARGLLGEPAALGAGGPVAVVLEDLHLADRATLDALPALGSEVVMHPVLVLGLYRSDGLARTHALRRARVELRRTGRLVDVVLEPLSRAGTGELLAHLLGVTPSTGLVAAVHDRTEGLPFFVEELAGTLRDSGRLGPAGEERGHTAAAELPLPESVADAVLARTADLRAAHPDAVEWAAVLGPSVHLDVLASLVGPDDVDALLGAGLLLEPAPGDEVARFRHGLVRDALYGAVPWGRRRALHRRAAQLMTRLPPVRDGSSSTVAGVGPTAVAEHWIAGREPARARPLLLRAADELCAVHAYRDALDRVRRALELWPVDDDPDGRLAAVEGLARCADLGGHPRGAVDAWQEVAQRHDEAGRSGRAAEAHRRAANAAGLLGESATAAGERAAAADAFERAGLLGDSAAERLSLAEHLKSAGRLAEALEHAVAATRAAERSGRRDLRSHALAFEGAVRAGLGQGARGVALARSGVALALAGPLTETAGATYYELGEALEYAADYAAAVDAYESAFEVCRDQGLAEQAQICFVCMSPAVRLLGDWDRTVAVCSEVLADPLSTAHARAVAEEESGLVLALRGDRRRAQPMLRRAVGFGRRHGIFGLEVGGLWGLALVAEADPGREALAQAVTTLLDRCRTSEECHYTLPALRWAASLLAGQADRAGVASCHRLVAALATGNGSAKVLSALAHVGAELALVEDGPEQAVGQYARSVELLTRISAPYEESLTRLRWGQACLATGHRERGIEQVASAYRTARRLGARPVARRCAEVLAATGEPVDRRLGRLAARALVPADLTRREQEVLRHLAAGRTNREIAAELYLSTRTVDMHVRHLFAKLGCSTRTAAVRTASERGLLGADA